MPSAAVLAREDHHPDRHLGYHLFMLVLCFYALGALAAEVAVRIQPSTREILDYADLAVCGIFLVDFVVELVRAKDRRRYLLMWGWLDLLSSIPLIHVARWARAARVVRIFRLVRGLRATKILASLIVRGRARSAFMAASLVALLLVVFCSIAILNVETAPESNIKTAQDAIWWAFATITTVGYGDRFPVTSEGRFVAGILMCGGVGLFGTFSGFLAAWFIGPTAKSGDDVDRISSEEARALREELVRLRLAIERRDPLGLNVGQQRSPADAHDPP